MYLGIDLGTSGVKVVLMDADQRVLASANGALEVSRPHDGWSEQAPSDWIAATEDAIADLKARHPGELAAVRGIGLSGQMHGATLIDRSESVIRPCILWNDTRSWREAAELDADPRFRKITGNIVFPRVHRPEAGLGRAKRAGGLRPRRAGAPAEGLSPPLLTGEAISEMSDSSGTAWLDVGARAWSDDLIAATGMRRDQMPALVEGTDPAARCAAPSRRDGAWAGRSSWRVVPATMPPRPSAWERCVPATPSPRWARPACCSQPTAAISRNPESAVHAFCHALPGAWHQMGVILSATDALNWLSGITGTSPADLTTALGDTLAEPSGVTFLPYLSGERTPHNDASIRGAFVGLGHGSDSSA